MPNVSTGWNVNVEAGTYVEQLEINEDIILAGAGISATTIESPLTLAKSFTTSAVNKPVVYVHDTGNAVIQNLTVNGLGLGNANARFMGIAYYEAGGKVDTVEVKNIENTPLSGSPTRVGDLRSGR